METKSLLAHAAAKGMRKLLHFQPVIGLKCVLNFQKWTYLYLCNVIGLGSHIYLTALCLPDNEAAERTATKVVSLARLIVDIFAASLLE